MYYYYHSIQVRNLVSHSKQRIQNECIWETSHQRYNPLSVCTWISKLTILWEMTVMQVTCLRTRKQRLTFCQSFLQFSGSMADLLDDICGSQCHISFCGPPHEHLGQTRCQHQTYTKHRLKVILATLGPFIFILGVEWDWHNTYSWT